MLWTDATLKPRILVVRLGHVDVHVDLTFLLEQDVVDWSNDLKKDVQIFDSTADLF